jgi:uncharacterized metal-binding protein YceD (DUF177 family)
MARMSEFERTIRIDTLGEGVRTIEIEADEAERAALAARFGLVAIDRLQAKADVRRSGETVFADGRIAAAVTQSCVATGADIPATIDAPFALRFVPEQAAGEEVELEEGELDEIGYEGAAIDLGEAVAQTLVLELDPFPRAPDADATLREMGVLSEEDAGPFAALKALLTPKKD